MCRILCFTNFLCMLKDFPHSSQVKTLSAVCVFLCSFKLLKLLNPREETTHRGQADGRRDILIRDLHGREGRPEAIPRPQMSHKCGFSPEWMIM